MRKSAPLCAVAFSLALTPPASSQFFSPKPAPTDRTAYASVQIPGWAPDADKQGLANGIKEACPNGQLAATKYDLESTTVFLGFHRNIQLYCLTDDGKPPRELNRNMTDKGAYAIILYKGTEKEHYHLVYNGPKDKVWVAIADPAASSQHDEHAVTSAPAPSKSAVSPSTGSNVAQKVFPGNWGDEWWDSAVRSIRKANWYRPNASVEVLNLDAAHTMLPGDQNTYSLTAGTRIRFIGHHRTIIFDERPLGTPSYLIPSHPETITDTACLTANKDAAVIHRGGHDGPDLSNQGKPGKESFQNFTPYDCATEASLPKAEPVAGSNEGSREPKDKKPGADGEKLSDEEIAALGNHADEYQQEIKDAAGDKDKLKEINKRYRDYLAFKNKTPAEKLDTCKGLSKSQVAAQTKTECTDYDKAPQSIEACQKEYSVAGVNSKDGDAPALLANQNACIDRIKTCSQQGVDAPTRRFPAPYANDCMALLAGGQSTPASAPGRVVSNVPPMGHDPKSDPAGASKPGADGGDDGCTKPAKGAPAPATGKDTDCHPQKTTDLTQFYGDVANGVSAGLMGLVVGSFFGGPMIFAAAAIAVGVAGYYLSKNINSPKDKKKD